MSDHIFDSRLLSKMARVNLDGLEAVVLVDDSKDMNEWARGAHCKAHCKNGHCNVLVKVLKGERGRVTRISNRLSAFDALEVGAFVAMPSVFKVLRNLLATSLYCTLAEAMQVIASEGKLGYETTEGLCWFGDLTLGSLAINSFSTAVRPEWRASANAMLRVASPKLTAVKNRDGVVVPLYQLGDAIGEGGTSTVFGGSLYRTPSQLLVDNNAGSQLAVKVIKRGTNDNSVCAPCGDIEKEVMWEVHVLQQLNHSHVVRVMDVIDVVDATYIVMERVDGPELTDYLYSFPAARLPDSVATLILSHIVAALRHAHGRGFLHCDLKPQNIRLNKECNRAVLTDWGCSRRPGMRPELFMQGTPSYASPEQLTGYSCDSITGSRRLCPATDVWSLGVLLHQMLLGKLPFEGDSYEALVKNVLRCQLQLPRDTLPIEASDLIYSMLQLAPYDRASISEICESRWLARAGHLADDEESKHRPTCEASAAQPPLRRYLVAGTYVLLCGLALWSHCSVALEVETLVAVDAH